MLVKNEAKDGGRSMKAQSIRCILLTSRAGLLGRRGVVRDASILASDGWRDRVSLRGAFLGARCLGFGNILLLVWLFDSGWFVGQDQLLSHGIGINEGHAGQRRALTATSGWHHLGLTSEALDHGVGRDLKAICAPSLFQDRCVCPCFNESVMADGRQDMTWLTGGTQKMKASK